MMKNKTLRLSTWLNNIPIQDPVDRQMAALLQVILIGFIGILLIAAILNFLLPDQLITRLEIIVRTSTAILVVGIPLFLLRRGYLRRSIFVIIAILLGLETYVTFIADLPSTAGTLTFFTFAILLAGLFVDRKALLITLSISITAISLNVWLEKDPVLKLNSFVIAGNFILLNGLMGLFLDQFGATLRTALKSALEREHELENEIETRKQTQTTLQQLADQLEILHEIDRSLLSARSPYAITKAALTRIRRLISCERASVSLFNFEKNEAFFLAAEFENYFNIGETPIPLEEYGQYIIDELKQNKPFFVNDVLNEPRAVELDRELAQAGIRAWLYLPLLYQGQLIGALNLGRGLGQPFTPANAALAQDVANQIAVAIQQTRLNNALQEQLSEREKLISQLEANNAELERFTYTVSHDLRNPLVTIKGFLGMLDKDIKDNQLERVQKDFQRIAGAADKMDELLTDLLELSRIGRIVNPPEEIDLVSLTQEALEMLDARIRSKNVIVTVSSDLPAMYGDRIRLREVIENLISNAIKYMGDQPEPKIEIGARGMGNESIIFVKDNGMGIEERYQSRVFTLFEKLDPTIEGTGIGLALVKRIIETHGGRVWVESEGLGKGSTFCFTMLDGGKQAAERTPK
jgi:signal transduction histidine kinase